MFTIFSRMLPPGQSARARHGRPRHQSLWKMVLLLITLVAVQTGAQSHFISHLTEHGHTAFSVSQAASSETPDQTIHCLECLALNGIHFPVPAPARAILQTRGSFALPPAAYTAHLGYKPFLPRCRAPPASVPA